MTARDKAAPWTALLRRDDRALMREFSHAQWTPTLILDRVPGMVFAALRSLHYSRSFRWGVAVSIEKMKPLAVQFLEWMKKTEEWEKHRKAWSQSKKGPWSLPFALFRSYYRFRRENFPEGVRGEVSVSGQRSLLELDSSIESAIASPFLEAFSFVTFSLPEPLQLTYQLHLEGLLTHEIAILLNKDPKMVENLVLEAKEHLSAGYSKLRESA